MKRLHWAAYWFSLGQSQPKSNLSTSVSRLLVGAPFSPMGLVAGGSRRQGFFPFFKAKIPQSCWGPSVSLRATISVVTLYMQCPMYGVRIVTRETKVLRGTEPNMRSFMWELKHSSTGPRSNIACGIPVSWMTCTKSAYNCEFRVFHQHHSTQSVWLPTATRSGCGHLALMPTTYLLAATDGERSESW